MEDSLSARFRAALGLLAALMLVRVASWTTGLAAFGTLTMLLAGADPFPAVILIEGLLRRDAPAALKWLVICGLLAFALLAVIPPGVVAPGIHSAALMRFQLVSLAAIGLMVLLRDRTDLAAAGNRALDQMLLSLLLILPLLIVDLSGFSRQTLCNRPQDAESFPRMTVINWAGFSYGSPPTIPFS